MKYLTRGWLVEAEEYAAQGTLAAAALPDQAKSFTFLNAQGDPIHRLQRLRLRASQPGAQATANREVFAQVSCLHQGLGGPWVNHGRHPSGHGECNGRDDSDRRGAVRCARSGIAPWRGDSDPGSGSRTAGQSSWAAHREWE